jgi:hypothetical protein
VLVPSELPELTAGPGQVVVGVKFAPVLFLDTQIRAGWGRDWFPVYVQPLTEDAQTRRHLPGAAAPSGPSATTFRDWRLASLHGVVASGVVDVSTTVPEHPAASINRV